MRNICIIKSCESIVVSHGLFDKHNMRKRKHGNPHYEPMCDLKTIRKYRYAIKLLEDLYK